MEWCRENGLKVNARKCKQISFYHTRNPLAKVYVIENEDLEVVKNIKDLGIILSSNLTFNNHIESICSKAFRNLGFIKRNCNEFKNPDCLITLYIALVRSGLEFGSTVWNINQIGLIDKIEKVQRRFIRFIAYKINMSGCSITDVEKRFNLVSLQARRKFIDVSFIFKMLNGMIECPEILEKIGIRVPSINTRNHNLFSLKFHKNNFVLNSPLHRMLRFCNELSNFDFFIDNINLLRIRAVN